MTSITVIANQQCTEHRYHYRQLTQADPESAYNPPLRLCISVLLCANTNSVVVVIIPVDPRDQHSYRGTHGQIQPHLGTSPFVPRSSQVPSDTYTLHTPTWVLDTHSLTLSLTTPVPRVHTAHTHIHTPTRTYTHIRTHTHAHRSDTNVEPAAVPRAGLQTSLPTTSSPSRRKPAQ